MKTELTIEQSQRLIELGVSRDKASSYDIYDEPCHRAYMPVFTLADLLGLLPKWIKYRNMVLWPKIWIDSYSETWCAAYKDIYDNDAADTFQSSEELVDCLAMLLEELIKYKLMQL